MDKYRILCVDDDIMMLNTLEDILTEADFQVSLAKSGELALKLLKKGVHCDLILLDVDMPELDGYETFERIREIEGCERTPIIFLTGMDSPDFEIRGLEIGASDYIVKPFFKNVLIARIRGQLRNVAAASGGGTALNEEAVRRMEQVLNESELAVARLIAEGLTNQEIAERTHYSYNYVKKVTSSILSKLDLSRRSEIRKLLKS